MKTKGITYFSFEQFVQSYRTNDDVLFDGCMVAHRNLQSHEDIDLFCSPCQINAYIGLFCRHGEISIFSNLKKYTFSDNVLFINQPNNIIYVESKCGLTIDCIAIAPDFLCKNRFHLKQVMSLILKLKNEPTIRLSPTDCNEYAEMLHCIRCRMVSADSSDFSKEAIRSSIGTLFYTICNHINRSILQRENMFPRNRNEEYFIRFIQLLSQHYKSERNVDFYASQLCITPKYLSLLIKNVSGKTAHCWIDEYVLLEAKNLLRYSIISVQEIAYQLNFSNQSFFGKYFKKYTGMSPKNYRQYDITTLR